MTHMPEDERIRNKVVGDQLQRYLDRVPESENYQELEATLKGTVSMDFCDYEPIDDTIYTQCLIRKYTLIEASLVQVCWIPQALTKVGQNIRIMKDGSWDKDWQVEKVYSNQTFPYLRQRVQETTRYRDTKRKNRK